MNDMNDATSLRVKEEIGAFDHFITNMQGETKKHVEGLMSQYGEAQEMLEIKGKIEREDVITAGRVGWCPKRRRNCS